jgi:LytS/YehU family sensor histidine kinase
MPAKIKSLVVYEPLHDVIAANRIYTDFSAVKIDDKTSGLIITMDKTDIASLYYVYLKYMPSGNVTSLLNRWGLYKDTLLMQINKDYFKELGEYELIVVPAIAGNFTVQPLKDRATTIRFTRRTDAVVAISYKQMAVIISFLIGIIVGFIVVKRKNRRKLAKEKLQKELAQLQLNTVRLQLNPHFMFNALAGIQNLMNKQEIDNANRYLGKFARITRHVLDNKELNSLAEEKSLLDDYLQMEQLRFGFQYTVDISVQLDEANIEIPSMLLQPFVENAVIHGVAGLQDKGWITVRFIKNEKDLQIVIKDNGSGFDVQQPYKGLGVSLSKNRISLLNKVYGQATVLLDMVSGEQGSTITITLKQWL